MLFSLVLLFLCCCFGLLADIPEKTPVSKFDLVHRFRKLGQHGPFDVLSDPKWARIQGTIVYITNVTLVIRPDPVKGITGPNVEIQNHPWLLYQLNHGGKLLIQKWDRIDCHAYAVGKHSGWLPTYKTTIVGLGASITQPLEVVVYEFGTTVTNGVQHSVNGKEKK